MAPDDNTTITVPNDSTGTNYPPVPNNPNDTTITEPPFDGSEENSGGGTTEDGRPRPDVGVGTFGLR